VIAWPASALLTGNGVAFVLRVPGTRHGDWWSVRGAWIFAAVGAVSLLSKYLIRVDGRPLFNPSNFGLVLVFLVLGSGRVDPLDFWWVQPGIALTLALTIIVVGGLVLAWRVKMVGLVASFGLTYAAALGVLAARGHCITARWHVGPVCNGYFWSVLVTSPEVLVVRFFMITDPKTVPRGRIARNVYGAGIALVFVTLAATQRTEYATKVALLGALAVVCTTRPFLERLLSAPAPRRKTQPSASDTSQSRRASVGRRARLLAVAAVVAFAYSAIVVAAGTRAATSGAAPTTPPTPASCADTATISTSRRPGVAPVPLPTITVRDSITVATRLSEQTARQIVRDVTDDLAIASEAIADRNPRLATDVARFPWLDDLITTACATTGPIVISSYRFNRATVTVSKRATGQVFPEIDVELQGTRRDTTITRSNPPRQLSERIIPYRDTLAVTKTGGYWLICGPRADRRTATCITQT
jgi:hypothetical protein